VTSRADVDLLAAIAANLHRMFSQGGTQPIQRRLHGWDAAGFTSGGDGGPTSVGEHSDPTARAALNPDTGDEYRQIVLRAKKAMLALEKAVAEATRPTAASKTELTDTFLGAAARPGSGVCEACGRDVPGLGRDKISRDTGKALCRVHREGFRRKRSIGWNVEQYVESTRAMLGADLGTL